MNHAPKIFSRKTPSAWHCVLPASPSITPVFAVQSEQVSAVRLPSLRNRNASTSVTLPMADVVYGHAAPHEVEYMRSTCPITLPAEFLIDAFAATNWVPSRQPAVVGLRS